MASFCHLSLKIDEATQVGDARRRAVSLADSLGFDEVAAGRVALVVTELGNNLVRHAGGGQLVIGAVEGEGDSALDIFSLDCGPGMPDVALSLSDGHSTGGTPGTGLGAVRRLAQRFDIRSAAPGGTVAWALLTASGQPPRPTAGWEVAAIRLPAPGETVCGDNWLVKALPHGLVVTVADGLGHGPQAQEAGDAAVELAAAAPLDEPVSRTLERVHARLRTTRGAAVAMAHVDTDHAALRYCGIGNIAGRVISGVSDRSLMSQHGTAGVQIRRLQETPGDWPAHAVLVMHSDGLTSRWDLGAARDLLQHHPALLAGWLVLHHLRGRDDATVLVARRDAP